MYNHVYNRAEHCEHHPKGKPWVFETNEEWDRFFHTEEEACEFQRNWRIENNLDPITGQ